MRPYRPFRFIKKKKTVAVGFFFLLQLRQNVHVLPAVSFIIFHNGNRLLYSYIYIRPNYRFPTGKMRRIVLKNIYNRIGKEKVKRKKIKTNDKRFI